MLSEVGDDFDVEIVEGDDPPDGPGAGEVGDRVDDHAAVAEVRQGVDLVDRLSRPRLVQVQFGGQQDDMAPLLLAPLQEAVALVGAAHAQQGRTGAGAHERVSAATGEVAPSIPKGERGRVSAPWTGTRRSAGKSTGR